MEIMMSFHLIIISDREVIHYKKALNLLFLIKNNFKERKIIFERIGNDLSFFFFQV